jgi:uncharacterized Zn-finger protein
MGIIPAAPRSIAVGKSSMDAQEIIETEDTVVACEGGGGALGHPRVFLNMGDDDHVECPYCSRRYVLKPGARRHGGH